MFFSLLTECRVFSATKETPTGLATQGSHAMLVGGQGPREGDPVCLRVIKQI